MDRHETHLNYAARLPKRLQDAMIRIFEALHTAGADGLTKAELAKISHVAIRSIPVTISRHRTAELLPEEIWFDWETGRYRLGTPQPPKRFLALLALIRRANGEYVQGSSLATHLNIGKSTLRVMVYRCSQQGFMPPEVESSHRGYKWQFPHSIA